MIRLAASLAVLTSVTCTTAREAPALVVVPRAPAAALVPASFGPTVVSVVGEAKEEADLNAAQRLAERDGARKALEGAGPIGVVALSVVRDRKAIVDVVTDQLVGAIVEVKQAPPTRERGLVKMPMTITIDDRAEHMRAAACDTNLQERFKGLRIAQHEGLLHQFGCVAGTHELRDDATNSEAMLDLARRRGADVVSIATGAPPSSDTEGTIAARIVHTHTKEIWAVASGTVVEVQAKLLKQLALRATDELVNGPHYYVNVAGPHVTEESAREVAQLIATAGHAATPSIRFADGTASFTIQMPVPTGFDVIDGKKVGNGKLVVVDYHARVLNLLIQ